MEKFSVSRLVGAPPGYVGYEEGGQLTEKEGSHIRSFFSMKLKKLTLMYFISFCRSLMRDSSRIAWVGVSISEIQS
jgi:hypothetical protein